MTPPVAFIRRVAELHGWPEVRGIAGTEAAWMAATARMGPNRQEAIFRLLEELEGVAR